MFRLRQHNPAEPRRHLATAERRGGGSQEEEGPSESPASLCRYQQLTERNRDSCRPLRFAPPVYPGAPSLIPHALLDAGLLGSQQELRSGWYGNVIDNFSSAGAP
jgi:hypothetical protein